MQVYEGDEARYEGPAKMMLRVVGLRKLPTGELAIQIDSNLPLDPTAYFVEPATRALVAREIQSEGAFFFQSYGPGYSRTTDGAAFLGFQLLALPTPGHSIDIAGETISLTSATARISLPILHYTLPATAPTHETLDLMIRIDEASVFPAELSTTTTGRSLRSQATAGRQPGLLLAPEPEPLSSSGGSVSWEGPIPPEGHPSRFRFALRDAFSVLKTDSRAFEDFAARNPSYRLCHGTYREAHPLVPPAAQTWALEFCDDDGSLFSASVTRRERPVEPFEVTSAKEEAAIHVVPRLLLPPRLVEIDRLWADTVSQMDWKQDSMHDVALVFDARSYQRDIRILQGTEEFARDLVRAKFIPSRSNGEQQFWYNLDDGSLQAVLGPASAAVAP